MSRVTKVSRARGLEVTGRGAAEGAPDVVRVRLGVSASRVTVAEAMAVADAAVRQVRAALAGAGVAGADAATAGLSVSAEQTWSEESGPKVTGYRADQELLITTRDVPGLGGLLGQVLAAGGDEVRLDGVEFAVADQRALQAAAREAAWADAASRAEQLAALAGRSLGEVLDLVESDAPVAVAVPMLRMAAVAKDAAEVSVSPGQVNVEVRLSVRWALG